MASIVAVIVFVGLCGVFMPQAKFPPKKYGYLDYERYDIHR